MLWTKNSGSLDDNKFFVTNNAVEGYNFRLKSIFRGEKVPFTV